MNYNRHINTENIRFDYIGLFGNNHSFDDEISSLGGKFFALSDDRKQSIFETRRQMENFFRKHDGEYEIMQCHTVFSWVLFSDIALKHGVKHIIAHSHSTRYGDKFISSIRNKLSVPLLPFCATDFVACSNAAKVLFGKRINREKQVAVFINAINPEKYAFDEQKRQKARKEFAIADDEILLGSIGRFAPQKNQRFLIDIFAEYKLINKKSKLLLAGGGPLLSDVKERVTEYNLADSVIFAGIRDDVPDLLSGMDLFLLPSLFEGFPVVGIEAQTSGLPCFFSDTITDEVNILNAHYLSLKTPAARWAKEIGKVKPCNDRILAEKAVSGSKFDIQNAALSLEKYYLSLE
jgi:glycosyltransferase involved in cell wall biosynthesis